MKKRLLAMLAFVALAVPACALDLGDKAPAITPEQWVTGDPADPTKADDKTIYLVEVWSTTCPPCVQSIPILNDLQARYADKDFKIVSFTSDAVEQVEAFLGDHPMEYSSFIDKEGATYINYMAADNRNTIPHAFLFDRSGSLVWIGNPLDNLEMRLKQVLDGALTREKAVAVRVARNSLNKAFEDQDIDGVLFALGELETLEPANGQYYQLHYRILTEIGAGDDNDVRKLQEAWFKGSRDQADSLVVLSLIAMEQGHPRVRNPELAMAAAKRAYEVEPGPDTGLNLAETYKGVGRLDLAAETIKALVKDASPDEIEMLAAIENFYSRLVEVGKNPDAEYKP